MKKTLNKALELIKEPNTITQIFNNLGTTYMMLGNHEKAIVNLEKTFDLKLKYLDEKNPSLATTHHNPSIIYDKMMDFNHTVEYCEDALRITDQSSYSNNHPLAVLCRIIIKLIKNKSKQTLTYVI